MKYLEEVKKLKSAPKATRKYNKATASVSVREDIWSDFIIFVGDANRSLLLEELLQEAMAKWDNEGLISEEDKRSMLEARNKLGTLIKPWP